MEPVTLPMRRTHMRPIAIAATILAAPAGAQSLDDWSGPFGGVSLGAGDGAVAGAFAGYQQDYGGLVLGGELEGSLGENADAVRLKLRAGAPVAGTLVYGLGGIGYADGTIGGLTGEGAGYVLGIGAEREVAPGLRLGAELTRDEYDFGIGDAEETKIRARLTLNF